MGSGSARVATWVRRRSARLLPGSEANDVGVPTDAWLGLTSLPLRGRLLPTRSAALKPRRCSRACFYGPAPGRLDSASHLHRSTREPSVCVNVPGEASRSPLRGSVRLGLACNQSGTPQGMILRASAPFAIDIGRRLPGSSQVDVAALASRAPREKCAADLPTPSDRRGAAECQESSVQRRRTLSTSAFSPRNSAALRVERHPSHGDMAPNVRAATHPTS